LVGTPDVMKLQRQQIGLGQDQFSKNHSRNCAGQTLGSGDR
jgi:hypothetical protein